MKAATNDRDMNGNHPPDDGTVLCDAPEGEIASNSVLRAQAGRAPREARAALPIWLVVATLLGGMSVALGAFGAHGLERVAESWPEAERQRRLDNWEVAARYQMYHALAMVGVAFHLALAPRRGLHMAATLFLLGTVIFSGCLYAYTLSGARFWGAIVPIGGSLLIVGWALWCWASLRDFCSFSLRASRE